MQPRACRWDLLCCYCSSSNVGWCLVLLLIFVPQAAKFSSISVFGLLTLGFQLHGQSFFYKLSGVESHFSYITDLAFGTLCWYFIWENHTTTVFLILLTCWVFSLVQDRPSTKVHAAPGGGSSLDYLFGNDNGGKWQLSLPQVFRFLPFSRTAVSKQLGVHSFLWLYYVKT